jgi:hypothetical protein
MMQASLPQLTGWRRTALWVFLGAASLAASVPYIVNFSHWQLQDWDLMVDAGRRIVAGQDPYFASVGAEAGTWRYSPILAYAFAAIAPIGRIGWALVPFLMLPLLRDWRLIGIFLIAVPFWRDVQTGISFVEIPLLAILALRGSHAAALVLIAFGCLMPRPLMLPLVAWLLWHRPELRWPSAAIFVLLTTGALLTGWADEWVRALLEVGGAVAEQGQVRITTLLGPLWVLMPFLAVWLTGRDRLGFASLAISPYWTPAYPLMLVLELPIVRATWTRETDDIRWRPRLFWRQRRRISVLIVAAAAVIATGIGWLYYVADRSDGPMLIAARRGDISCWPENTMPAVLSAAQLGADAIEVDVHQSADGTLWLMHDDFVDRTTNGSGAVAGLSDADLERLTIDGGLGYSGHRGLGVPRFSDVLDALANYRGLVIVDAKPGTEAASIAAVITGTSIMLSAYTAEQVAALKAVMPRVPVNAPPGITADYERIASPLPIAALFADRLVTPISASFAGTEFEAMERARRWGAEIYMTNNLRAALSWDRGRGQTSGGSAPCGRKPT